MNGNRSVATIDEPQFINLQQDAINPGISKCEIKVFYLGKNRNGSFITRDVAIQMANSLPGCPIVGAFRKDVEDFGDHGHVIHMEDGEVEFSCKTIPYGFVAPDALVWFQKFTDTDEFGNEIEREYLMTTGYLWTSQYEEVRQCITEGKGQSMELDPDAMDGHWATDNSDGIEFFIINDAIFTKLCILGDDVEPCFEGASVTAPQVSKNFSKDPEFSQTLYTMMNELKFALNKGGSNMPEDMQTQPQEEVAEEFSAETVEVEETAEGVEDTSEEFAQEDTGEAEASSEFSEEASSEFSEDEEEDAAEEQADELAEDDGEEEPPVEEEKPAEDDDEPKRTEHSLGVSPEEFAAMQEELKALRAYRLEQENAKKDEIIRKYFMLSNEDKAEVVANKEQYSLEEIESKLALIYVQKNVDFSTVDGVAEEVGEREESPITTFSLDNDAAGIVSPLVARLRESL